MLVKMETVLITCFKYYLNFILILLLMNNAFPQTSIENVDEDESTSLTYGVENDFVTRYIWHGLSCNHGIINQPSLWLNYSDFTISSWASFTHHEFDNNAIYNEIDFSLGYLKEFEIINIEAALTYIYGMHSDMPATMETYLKISYKIWEMEFFSDVTADVMEYSGSLSGEVGASKNFLETDDVSVTASLSIGWANKLFNESYIGTNKNVKPFNYTSLSAEATYYIYENFYIKPHLEYCYLLSPVLKQTSGNGLENFGIGIGVEF